MKSMRGRLIASACGLLAALMVSACAVTGVGVEGSVGYDAGYYAPYGYDYGGWGVGYAVGPGRCCDHRDERHDRPDRGRGGQRPAYRPAAAGRPAPSIPGRHRTH